MGEHHTAVITTEGVLYTFGDGAYGALGNGNSNFTLSPHLVAYFDEKVTQVILFQGKYCKVLPITCPDKMDFDSYDVDENGILTWSEWKSQAE